MVDPEEQGLKLPLRPGRGRRRWGSVVDPEEQGLKQRPQPVVEPPNTSGSVVDPEEQGLKPDPVHFLGCPGCSGSVVDPEEQGLKRHLGILELQSQR